MTYLLAITECEIDLFTIASSVPSWENPFEANNIVDA